MSASDPLIRGWLEIFAKILPTLQPHMLVQAKTWFPSNEMQKSPNLTNEPLCHFTLDSFTMGDMDIGIVVQATV